LRTTCDDCAAAQVVPFELMCTARSATRLLQGSSSARDQQQEAPRGAA